MRPAINGQTPVYSQSTMPSDILTMTQEQLDELTNFYPAVFKRNVAKENYNIISFDHVRGGHAVWRQPASNHVPNVWQPSSRSNCSFSGLATHVVHQPRGAQHLSECAAEPHHRQRADAGAGHGTVRQDGQMVK